MELTADNLRKYVEDELEQLTSPVNFQYGYRRRIEVYWQLQALLRVVQQFGLGRKLYRDIAVAMEHIKDWLESHESYTHSVWGA